MRKVHKIVAKNVLLGLWGGLYWTACRMDADQVDSRWHWRKVTCKRCLKIMEKKND